MSVVLLQSPAELEEYRAFVAAHPQKNLWQSLERKAYCQAVGQNVRLYGVRGNGRLVATAQVVMDASRGGSTWEVPRGPLWTDDVAARELCEGIIAAARAERSLAVFFSPMNPLPPMDGLRPSGRSVQAEATRIVDLGLSEAELIAQMHPKGRYNIRVAEKNGVTVEESNDAETFYRLLRETGERDGFGILPQSRYRAFLDHLQGSFLLIAKAHGRPIAGLLGVVFGEQGIYYYGASSYASRALMAPYALQWASIRHCKGLGCISYDLLGVAPPNAPRNHSWAGISDFKAKFGGQVVLYPSETTVVLRPVRHMLLSVKRRLVG